MSISLTIIWLLKKPILEKEIKAKQTEPKEKNEQKANDFNNTIDDIKSSIEPLEIESLQVPRFDYSCYIATYKERISSTLKIICYENFWLIEKKDLKKFNQIQSKITLTQINTLYSLCLKEWNNIQQGQKLNYHFETISIDGDTKYKAPYSIDIEKNNFLMTTEIGKMDFSNYIETVDALEYALKYGDTLVKKYSNKGDILTKDEYDVSNKNPCLSNLAYNDVLNAKTDSKNNTDIVTLNTIKSEEIKQENNNVSLGDTITKLEAAKAIERDNQKEEITKQEHNIKYKEIIEDDYILPSIEELNKIWQKYVENNSHFIKDTIKDLTSDDIDLILDRYKESSKYRKLMANYFEDKIDRTETEVVGKEISLYRLDPNQIKEKFNYKKLLKNGTEVVIRDTFWYVSKEIIPSSKTYDQGIYNRHHYYQEIHYKLAIAQAKKMHKFYLNNKSKYKLKGQETLHYDFKDIIYIYDWSKYKCSYSIDISSSGYIMKLETGKIFYNGLIDKNNDAFKGFIRECLNIINYGNSMAKEYGKGSNKKNMNIVENKYSNNSNASTNSKILNKRIDILDVDDPACTFRINIDVLNEAFGLNRSMYAKAWYPDSKYSWFSATNSKEQFYIWMPKMYNNSSGCTNSISYDETKIYEIIDGPNGIDATETSNADIYGYNYRYGYRLVFIKEDPKSPYRFVGVFKPSRMEHNNHTYERIATKIKLIGNPVTSIEILDK